jgi:hypothetical protein
MEEVDGMDEEKKGHPGGAPSDPQVMKLVMRKKMCRTGFIFS